MAMLIVQIDIQTWMLERPPDFHAFSPNPFRFRFSTEGGLASRLCGSMSCRDDAARFSTPSGVGGKGGETERQELSERSSDGSCKQAADEAYHGHRKRMRT